ncbi:MAG: hypothetical protein M5R36_06410 [Deltaproteobacteria bacterium]|nr:hypothetical protein [Deltaproteobacteria bacterium]
MSFYEKVANIDRRVIFLLIGLAVAIPIIFTVRFPGFPTPMVQEIFDLVENLPAGSKVLVSFDYDPASEPELQPMATAWMRQCIERGFRIYIMALWPIGQDMARLTVDQLKRDIAEKERLTGKKVPFEYGVNYVDLGYKSGAQGVINVVLTDFEKMYPTDSTNQALSSIPMMSDTKSLKDLDLIISISAGTPGLKEWIQFGADPAGVKIIGGSTAVQAPLLYPYYPKQLSGQLGGLKTAAEYEKLMGDRYPQYSDIKDNKGRIRMGAQAIAHIVIMLFIVVGNITFFIDRRRGKRG